MEKTIHGQKVTFTKSNDGVHKYNATFVNKETGREKTVKFGNIGYEHYKDKLGKYSGKDHEDASRRKAYKDRHSEDRKWKGHITAGYLADKILW